MRIDPYDLPYLGSCPLPFEIVTTILTYNLAYDTASFAYRTFDEDDEEVMEKTRGNLLSKTSLRLLSSIHVPRTSSTTQLIFGFGLKQIDFVNLAPRLPIHPVLFHRHHVGG